MQEKQPLDREKILNYLKELGKRLEESGRKKLIRVIVLGGAYLILSDIIHRTTEDVDILVLMPDLAIYYHPQKPMAYRHFWDTVEQLTIDLHLNPKWMNDKTGEFMIEFEPEGKLWQKYGYLEVLFPDPEAVFAMKMMAYRDKDK